jgi:hypothetical protein
MTTVNVYKVDELSYGVYTTTLKDEDGVVIALSAIDSITMTIIEFTGDTVINSRNGQDVLNTNNCTMHATSGLFTWEIQTGDTAIVLASPSLVSREVHLVTITVVWNTTKQMHREIKLRVRNLSSVPQ